MVPLIRNRNLAYECAGKNGSTYIFAPVVDNEFNDTARIPGIPEVPPTVPFHALNQKAVARCNSDEGKTCVA